MLEIFLEYIRFCSFMHLFLRIDSFIDLEIFIKLNENFKDYISKSSFIPSTPFFFFINSQLTKLLLLLPRREPWKREQP